MRHASRKSGALFSKQVLVQQEKRMNRVILIRVRYTEKGNMHHGKEEAKEQGASRDNSMRIRSGWRETKTSDHGVVFSAVSVRFQCWFQSKQLDSHHIAICPDRVQKTRTRFMSIFCAYLDLSESDENKYRKRILAERG